MDGKAKQAKSIESSPNNKDRSSSIPTNEVKRKRGREASAAEPTSRFEERKADHIRLALASANQAAGAAGFERIALVHEALPELNFSEVGLAVRSLARKRETPFFIASMTAGHGPSTELNLRLARAAESRGWRMGVGSQRRELGDPGAAKEWKKIRAQVPKLSMFGNIGLAQLIVSKINQVERLVEDLEASAMIVHLNALQECLQPEGTPQFKGGLKAIERLVKKLSVPVIVKETGCGFSHATLKRLKGIGVAAVDVSGLGGTHWGRIEGGRGAKGDVRGAAAKTLADWGVPTVDSVLGAVALRPDYEVWASGGVRSGLDAAKLLSLGARAVGIAKPVLESALQGDEKLQSTMAEFEFELKTILFCTGCKSISELQRKKVWTWATTR